MYQKLIDERTKDFDKAITHLEEELHKLRTGRAHLSLIENLSVDYYGNPTPLKQIANISIPESRQFLIQPWDKEALPSIEAALKVADMGLNPSNEGEVLRITLPPMTEENRHDIVKILNQRSEECRVAVRTVREEIWREIQDAQKNGDIAEDEKFTGKDILQKKVDEYNASIEELRKRKEEEIMTV